MWINCSGSKSIVRCRQCQFTAVANVELQHFNEMRYVSHITGHRSCASSSATSARANLLQRSSLFHVVSLDSQVYRLLLPSLALVKLQAFLLLFSSIDSDLSRQGGLTNLVRQDIDVSSPWIYTWAYKTYEGECRHKQATRRHTSDFAGVLMVSYMVPATANGHDDVGTKLRYWGFEVTTVSVLWPYIVSSFLAANLHSSHFTASY